MLSSRPSPSDGRSPTSLRLGELLVADGVIGNHELDEALRLQRYAGGLLGTNLLERGSVSETQLLGALGKHHRASTISGIRLRRIPPHVIDLVPAEIARRYQAVPFQVHGESLRIATVDPRKAMLVEQAIREHTHFRVRAYVALEFRVHEALKRYYGQATPARIDALTRRLRKPAAQRSEWTWPQEATSALPVPADAMETDETLLRDTQPHSWDDRIVIRETSAEALQEVAADNGPAVSRAQNGVVARAARPPARRRTPPPRKARAAQKVSQAPVRASASPLALTHDEPDGRLEDAAQLLQRPLSKNQVAHVALEFCQPFLERRILFLHRRNRIVGWKSAGPGVNPQALQLFQIRAEDPSVFFPLARGSEFWMGPLPPFDTQRHFEALLEADIPSECLVVPVELRDRPVAYLYGDNGAQGVRQAPVKQLRRLATKLGLAFELCILRSKLESA